MNSVRQMFLFGILILSCACRSNSQDSVERQLDTLREEILALKKSQHDFLSLKQDVGELRAELTSRTRLADPLRQTSWKIDQSYLDDPFMGPKDSEFILMAFSEYQSKQCQMFNEKVLPRIKKKFIDTGKLKFVLRDFPLASHPQAVAAARFAHCAGEQGSYWRAAELLFENREIVDKGDFGVLIPKFKTIQSKRFEDCNKGKRYDHEILLDIEDGKRLGVTGAPGFFLGKREGSDLYRGIFIRGAQPYAVFEAEIEKLLPKG